jgi:hypothetical protein
MSETLLLMYILRLPASPYQSALFIQSSVFTFESAEILQFCSHFYSIPVTSFTYFCITFLLFTISSDHILYKKSIFWDMTFCSPLKIDPCFGGTCRLRLQGRIISQARNQHETGRKNRFLAGGVIYQMIKLFIIIAVRTSNLINILRNFKQITQ